MYTAWKKAERGHRNGKCVRHDSILAVGAVQIIIEQFQNFYRPYPCWQDVCTALDCRTSNSMNGSEPAKIIASGASQVH